MSEQCERMLMAMPKEGLQALSEMFANESISDGLPIERFIPVVSTILPIKVQKDPHLFQDLRELFAQIDVDGSGTVSWQEFSDFCVDAGFVASAGEARIRPASTKYLQRTSFLDPTLHLPSIESMISFVVGELQILAVCDARHPNLRVYLVRSPPQGKQEADDAEDEDEDEDDEDDDEDEDDNEDIINDNMDEQDDDLLQSIRKRFKHRGKVPIETDEDVLARISHDSTGNVYFLGEVIGKAPSTYTERSRGERVIEEGGFLATCWMPSLNIIACSRSSLCITFWNIHSLHEKPPRFSPMLLSSINTVGPQHCLAWHDSSKSLFAAGDSSFRVTRYAVHVESAGQRKLNAIQIASYVAHSQTITTLLVLDTQKHPMLASGSSDGFVHLFWLNGSKENRYYSSRPPLIPGSLPYQRNKHNHMVYRVCRSRVRAHETGVRLMCNGGNGLLLTCSFDFNVFGWNTNGVTEQPLFQFKVGRTPLLGVLCMPNSGYCITTDIDGTCNRWDLQRIQNVAGDDGHVEIFMPVDTTSTLIEVPGQTTSTSCCHPTSCVMFSETTGTVLLGGRKIYMFDPQPLSQAESPVVDLVYNDVSMTILGACGKSVKVWNVIDGTLVNEFANLTSTNITSLTLDGRQRKFIIGDTRGDIKCFNILNGGFMGSILLQSHTKAISSLSYIPEDRILITSSWDRSIHVYHDTPPLDGENPYLKSRTLLRTIEDAHTSDITCTAVSRRLSLIATGDTNGWVKVWDLEFCRIDGIGLGHSTEITTMLFVDPHPCLITSDANANICIWGVRPYYPKYHVLWRGRIPRTVKPMKDGMKLKMILDQKVRESVMREMKEKDEKDRGGDGDNDNDDTTFLTGVPESQIEEEEDVFGITTMTRVHWNIKDVSPPPEKDPFADSSDLECDDEGKHLIPQGDLSNLSHHEWKDKWKKENIAGERERTDEDLNIFIKEVELIEREESMNLKEVRKKMKRKRRDENDSDESDSDESVEQKKDDQNIFIMCTTDDGQMTIFNLLQYLPKDMIASPIKEHLLPPQLNSFNPLRRVSREGDDKAALEMKMKEVFRIFDTDGSGDIDVDELEEAFSAMGHNFTKEECYQLIMEADDDNSGVVEFEEFVGLIAIAQQKTKDREMEILQSMNNSQKNTRRKSVAYLRNENENKTSSEHDQVDDSQKGKTWTKENTTGGGKGAPFIEPLHSWKGHQSSITALKVINEPKRYLTTSSDGTVCIWNGQGQREGILTRGSRKDEEIIRLGYHDDWNFPINLELREQIEHAECIQIQERIQQYQEKRLQEEEELRISRRRTSSMRESRSGSVSSEELRRMTSGLHCVQGSPQDRRNRLVGQLKGQTTWEENGPELGYKRMIAEERKLLLYARNEAKKERRLKAPDEQSRQLDDLLANDHIDPKVSKYVIESTLRRKEVGTCKQIKIIADSATSEMPYDELAAALSNRAKFRAGLDLPQIYKIPPMHLPPDEEGNWMLNSINKQRSLYPKLYDEKGRMNAKEAKKAAMKDTMKIITKPSTFLLSELLKDELMKKQEIEKKDNERKMNERMALALGDVDDNDDADDIDGADDANDANDINEDIDIANDKGNDNDNHNDDARKSRTRRYDGILFDENENVDRLLLDDEVDTQSDINSSQVKDVKGYNDGSTRTDHKVNEHVTGSSKVVSKVEVGRRLSAQDCYDTLRRHPLQQQKEYDNEGEEKYDRTLIRTASTDVTTTTTTPSTFTSSSSTAPSLTTKSKKAMQKKKLQRKLQRASHKRLYGASSAPNLHDSMQFNRDQRLIDGPSKAELIMSHMSKDLQQVFSQTTKKKKKRKRSRKKKTTVIKKRNQRLNKMDPLEKKRLLEKLNKLKHDLQNSKDNEINLPNSYATKRELRDQLRLNRIQRFKIREENEKLRLQTLSHDSATFDRLSVKKNFGTYQIDMIRMFRKVIQEVDDDQSGEIDRDEFMMAISKIHDHQDAIDESKFINSYQKHQKLSGNTLRMNSDDHETSLVNDLALMKSKNQDDVKRMVDSMFAALDEDSSGTVSIAELVGVLFPKARDQVKEDIILYLMMDATPREIRSSEEEYGVHLGPVSEAVRKELRQLFDIYDVDKSGTLTVDELRNAMSSAFLFESTGDEPLSATASSITTTDFERIILASDMNGDGILDFNEWIDMMRHFFE
jgi:Ca2+-binding EF-hand superfamily protein